MSLKHIMLGLCAEPHSGYDIKKQFEFSLNNFWHAELSQIYPLLRKMEKDGLLKSRQGTSDLGPTKRIYRRSAKGKRELQKWLTDGPTVGTERLAFLAQIYFLADLNKDKAIKFFEELRGYMTDYLATLENIEKEWSSDDPRYPDKLPDEEFYPQLTLALGLVKIRAIVDWCDDCIRRIGARKKSC